MVDVEVELTTATVDDLDAVLELRSKIADWMARRGVDMWQTPLRRELLAGWIEQSALWVCRDGDRIVGTVALLEGDPEFWGDDRTPARYVHLLMVDRAHAGRNLGGRILACAEQLAQADGARYLRLDAATTIEPLQLGYDERGYVAAGSRVVTAGTEGPKVTLRQKDLRDTTSAAPGDGLALQQVTWLQMLDPTQLRPARPVDGLDLQRVHDPVGDAAALRDLHDRIARPHHWSSLDWDDERWRTWLAGHGQRHWFIEDHGRRIGWASLQAHDHGEVEIDNFGLVPEALGSGRGGAALTLLAQHAWAFADELRRQQRHELPSRVRLSRSADQQSSDVAVPVRGDTSLAEGAWAPKPARTSQLAAHVAHRRRMAPPTPRSASLARRAVRRSYPR